MCGFATFYSTWRICAPGWRIGEYTAACFRMSLILLQNTNYDFHIFRQFHLAKGVFVTSGQATKILNKKPTLVAKDTAQAIWTNEVLADRSVHGGVAPNKRALGERAKKQLSPEKVQVVAATVRYWGSKKSIDVDSTVAALSRLLSEKIQDARKSLKKQGTKTHDSEGLNAQGQNTQDQDAQGQDSEGHDGEGLAGAMLG